jgi:hypothetical protein
MYGLVIFPPPPWVNQNIIVYHGTVDSFAAAIVSGPILVSLGKTLYRFWSRVLHHDIEASSPDVGGSDLGNSTRDEPCRDRDYDQQTLPCEFGDHRICARGF